MILIVRLILTGRPEDLRIDGKEFESSVVGVKFGEELQSILGVGIAKGLLAMEAVDCDYEVVSALTLQKL